MATVLAGCAAQPPIQTNSTMLSSDFVNWMVTQGDSLVKTWQDGSGMTVYTTQLQTGWAVMMQTQWGERIAYFLNSAAWTTFLARIQEAGFVIAQRVSTPIILLPVIIPSDGDIDSMLDLIPGMSSVDS